mgnify:FL=1
MIEKDYIKEQKSRVYKTLTINTNCISKTVGVKSSIRCNMQSSIRTGDEIILLINPLMIKGESNSYDLNEKNKFKNTKEFKIGDENTVNSKLEKKSKKLTKDTENVKSKLKLKKKINAGGFDETNTIKNNQSV